jgi:type VI protein secretion system component Hcp
MKILPYTLCNGLIVTNITECTTRNARRVKYYNLTLEDKSIVQLTLDTQSNLFLSGKQVNEVPLYLELLELTKVALRSRL